MVSVIFNGVSEPIVSIEQLGEALDRFDRYPRFEVWLSAQDGPSICMLRSEAHAWLMYLRFAGDGGFVSQGQPGASGFVSYTLANGQIDEYPLAWCLDLEQCYKALAYFFVNKGARPEFVSWSACS